MKLASYRTTGREGWGVVTDDGVAPLHHRWPSLATGLSASSEELEAECRRVRERVLTEDLAWLPPVPTPQKIICVGLNYGRHVAESARELPAHPTLFTRFPTTFVGHQQSIVRPKVSRCFDYEAELAVVIGKAGRHIAPADAMSHIAGYTCLADNSVRDYQKHATQVTPGKNFDESGAAGPWLTTADEVSRPADLIVIGRLNGVEMQRGKLSDLLYPIHELISYISSFTTLRPGDVIATGTPEGVGAARNPPRWMAPGDTLEVEISGLGVLRNSVVDENGTEEERGLSE